MISLHFVVVVLVATLGVGTDGQSLRGQDAASLPRVSGNVVAALRKQLSLIGQRDVGDLFPRQDVHGPVGKSVTVGRFSFRIISNVFQVPNHDPFSAIHDKDEGTERNRLYQSYDFSLHGLSPKICPLESV